MSNLEKYCNFCNDFENVYSKSFTDLLNNTNLLFGKYKFYISYNIDFNSKNYFENVKLYTDKTFYFNFFIKLDNRSENIFFIQYKNDNAIYVNDLINKTHIYGNLNDILKYIESKLELYHMVNIINRNYGYKDNFEFYTKTKFNDVDIDKYITLTLTLTNNIQYYNRTFLLKEDFLFNLEKKIFSKNIYEKYDYLFNAIQFDLI